MRFSVSKRLAIYSLATLAARQKRFVRTVGGGR